MTFGAKMCELMTSQNVSLRRLAIMINYDPGYLSKISRDLKPVRSNWPRCLIKCWTREGNSLLLPQESHQQKRVKPANCRAFPWVL